MKNEPSSLQECLDNIRHQYKLSVPVFQELIETVKQNNQCKLCHSFLSSSSSDKIQLKCHDRHVFHKSCLFPLLVEKGDCPVCHDPVLSSAHRSLQVLTSSPTGVFALMETPVPPAIVHYATNTTLYRYHSEGTDDFGWGCAWRSIQTCLSHYGITITMADLYHRFGREESLIPLYRQIYPNHPWTLGSSYADPRGWADPIIGQLILHGMGIRSDLFFVNGRLRSTEDYSWCPILNFRLLQQRLLQHFQTHKSPVMIDDDLYTMTILGIGVHDGLTSLWIGDPHVMRKITIPSIGIYVVILDEQGNFLDTSLTPAQKKQMFSQGSYGIHFARKRWMILFPTARFRDPVDDLDPLLHLSTLLS
uniref:RING-type domain-containing protein n=1 Tax=viral metagenome TaxID=1070528 RepID=A0A6C0K5X3_9ZZZZ